MEVLRRLAGKPKTRRLATIDIETRAWVEPYAVGFFDGAEYTDFVDYAFEWRAVDEALRFVLMPKYHDWWIYAHNGGNFDFTFFLRHIIAVPWFRKRFTVEVTPIGSCIVRFDVRERVEGQHKPQCLDPLCRGCDGAQPKGTKGLKWTFVDSARLMPLPLNEVGAAFGIGSKVDTGMTYDELAAEENTASMRRYLRTDCVLLYDAIAKMQETINTLGGQIGVTLPATALDLYRRRFLDSDIHPSRHSVTCPMYNKKKSKGSTAEEECRGCLHRIIRDAYAGGRTEIFRMEFNPYQIGNKKVAKAEMYDVSSHYPACMLEPMPTGQAVELQGLTEEAVLSNARNMIGIVECDVEIPDDCYLPPLPFKQKGKLIFPTGRLSGTWDTAELALLSRVGGRIVRTRTSLWFEATTIFARFIRQLYKFRNKKSPAWNAGMDWIAKILMNSLYGKFAMVEERSKIIIHPDSPEGLKCINFEADVWGEDCFVSPTYVIPQLSVHVTALARARLWELLTNVLQQGGRIYYTDTDSEIVSGAKVKTGDGLGDLKHEGSIKRAVFSLPKLYLVEWDETPSKSRKKLEQALSIKAKGLGPGIRLGQTGDDPFAGQLSESEFFDFTRNGVPIERHRISKLREALNKFAASAQLFPSIVSTPKRMRSAYDKRIVCNDFDTRPVRVHCW